MRPRIAMTGDLGLLDGRQRVHLPYAYVEAVVAAGGAPVVLPPADGAAPEELLAAVEGLLLIGGGDLDPSLWGEPKHPKTETIDPRRQRSDLALLAAAEACGMPVLGICLGIQEMAAHRGGRLIQHVQDEKSATIEHSGSGRTRAMHNVVIEPDSLLARVLRCESVVVNSSHHQAVGEAGRGMRIVARSPDGFIEGIEDAAPGRFFLGIQWHPETLIDRPPHLALFEALCRAAAAWAKSRK
jgi:putative glutamine amidotransferase